MRTPLLILAACALLAVGCQHGPHHKPFSKHPHGMPPGQAKKIGHAVHMHGMDCGHSLVDGIWVAMHVQAAKHGPKHKK